MQLAEEQLLPCRKNDKWWKTPGMVDATARADRTRTAAVGAHRKATTGRVSSMTSFSAVEYAKRAQEAIPTSSLSSNIYTDLELRPPLAPPGVGWVGGARGGERRRGQAITWSSLCHVLPWSCPALELNTSPTYSTYRDEYMPTNSTLLFRFFLSLYIGWPLACLRPLDHPHPSLVAAQEECKTQTQHDERVSALG